jgi:hypothetical protein
VSLNDYAPVTHGRGSSLKRNPGVSFTSWASGVMVSFWPEEKIINVSALVYLTGEHLVFIYILNTFDLPL